MTRDGHYLKLGGDVEPALCAVYGSRSQAIPQPRVMTLNSQDCSQYFPVCSGSSDSGPILVHISYSLVYLIRFVHLLL